MRNQTAMIPLLDKGLVAFHASWHDVNWNDWIVEAESSLDIVVYYWDKWTEKHLDALKAFLLRPEAKIRFFFSDDSDPALLKFVQQLFPDHTNERIREKIVKTVKPLEDYILNNSLPENKLQVIKVPHLLNYPFQIIDDRWVVFSLFEMFRDKQADAPLFIVDMHNSPGLAKFFRKELHCLLYEKRGR